MKAIKLLKEYRNKAVFGSNIARIDQAISELEEVRELRKVMTEGVYTPIDCLEILSKAAKHFLDDHNCDCHGYECISLAASTAKAHIHSIKQAIDLIGGE